MSHSKTRGLSLALLATGLLALGACDQEDDLQDEGDSLPDPTPHLEIRWIDHFICYRGIQDPQQSPSFSTRDQFDDGRVKRWRNQGLQIFCDPVEKRWQDKQEGIVDDRNHLAGFLGTDDEPEPADRRKLLFANQFSPSWTPLEVLEESYVLVPTAKTEPKSHDEPWLLDHYKCYDVAKGKGGEPKEEQDLPTVDLFDENVDTLYENTVVGPPAVFCNPTEKYHPEKPPTHIMNFPDHLVCYDIARELPEAIDFAGTTQFGGVSLKAAKFLEWLCVPSLKELPRE